MLLIAATGDVDEMDRAFALYHPSKVIRRTIPDQTIENLKEAAASQDAQASQAPATA